MFNINPLNNLGRTVKRTVASSGRPAWGAFGGLFSMLKLAAIAVAVLSVVSPATLQQHLPDWRGGTGFALIAVAGLALFGSIFRALRGTFGIFMWLAVLAIMGRSLFFGSNHNLSLPKNPVSNQSLSGVLSKLNPFAKASPSELLPSELLKPQTLGITEQLKDPELRQVVKAIESSWLNEESDMKFDSLNDKGGEFVELMSPKRGVRQILPNAPVGSKAGDRGGSTYRLRGDQEVGASGEPSGLGGELVELFSNKAKGIVKGKPGQEHDLTYSTQSVFGAQSGLGAALASSSVSDGTIVGRGDNIYFAKPSTAKLGASLDDGGNNITSKISSILGR